MDGFQGISFSSGLFWGWLVVATHIFFRDFRPETLGKMKPFWRAYFSIGLKAPLASSKSTWKWMVGIRSFPFAARPIFRGELAVSFRAGITPPKVQHGSPDDGTLALGDSVFWKPLFLHPVRLTWNLQITQFRKEHDLPNLHDDVPC